jgi:hypothetical protein
MQNKYPKKLNVEAGMVHRLILATLFVDAAICATHASEGAQINQMQTQAFTTVTYQSTVLSPNMLSNAQEAKQVAVGLEQQKVANLANAVVSMSSALHIKTDTSQPKSVATETSGAPDIHTYVFNTRQLSWLAIRAQCESGDDPSTDTGNGYYGLFQYSEPTWLAVPYVIRGTIEQANQAPALIQEEAIAYTTDHEGGNNHTEPSCDKLAEEHGTSSQAQEVIPGDVKFLAFLGEQAYSARYDTVG